MNSNIPIQEIVDYAVPPLKGNEELTQLLLSDLTSTLLMDVGMCGIGNTSLETRVYMSTASRR